MAQYIIDIGAVPDDGQGDPLRTAFDYTNENFNQIFAAGPVLSNIQIGNNTITTTVLNSNLILSPSGIGRIQLNNTLFPRLDDVYDIGTPGLRFNSLYLGIGGIDTTGGITTSGNVTADYFIGNGSQLTGIVATTGSEVVNGNSNILIPSSGSNIFVTVNGTSNVVTFATTGVYVAGQVSASGNISGNYILGNGALLTGINIGYGNSNVAAFLPTYTGNLVSLTGPVTTTANVTGGNLRTAGQISATGNITSGNISTGRLNAGYITSGTTISAIGNISTSAYFIGDGSQLTGINANYSNSNVAAFLPTYTGNLVSLTGPVTTTANISGGNLRSSGLINASGNIIGANLDTNKVTAANIISSGAISAIANIATSAYFIGDGSQLTNLPAGNYSNANVAAYLPLYTGSMSSMTGLLRTTGTIIGGNITAIGNVTSGNVDTNRVNAGNVTVSGPVSATGNITTAAYFIGDGSQLTGLPASNYSNANVAAFLPTYTGNLVSLTGPVITTSNIAGGNLRTVGQISATGNITGGNVDTTKLTATNIVSGGNISAVGNVVGNNVIASTITGTTVTATSNVVAGNVNSNGQVQAAGNIQGGNLNAPGGTVASYTVSATGQIRGGNLVTTGFITAVGNITGGNVDTGNLHAGNISVDNIISATGNIYANNFIGNITATNYSVTGNIVAGNLISLGAISAAANISGNYFVGNGALLTGITVTAGTSLVNGTSNVVVEPSGNIDMSAAGTSNVVAIANTGVYVNGLLSVSGNVAGNYILGNGAFLTGVASSYGNADVANYLPTYTGNLVSLTGPVITTSNIAGGNILSNNYYYANGTPVPPGITYTANISPPVTPAPKVTDQWYDTANDILYEFLNDGTSTYWVDTNSPAFAGGVVANVVISGNMLPVANVTFNIGNASAYFNTAFLQTASVAGNVVAGNVRSDTVVASVLANTTAINLQTNGTNALSVDSNQYITTYRRFAASSMPVGSVVQTVMSSSLGGSITNSTSYADITYATVTITPTSASSKILILATGTTSFTPLAGNNVTADTQLVRSPTISLQIQNYGSNVSAGGIGGAGSIAYSYQDSPGTTSPVTYKLQQKISNASSTLTSTNIWLIAMEIAA